MKIFAALVLVVAFAHSVRGNETGSVYDLNSTWTDQAGQSFNIRELRGSPCVMVMFFSSCTYACPRITADLKNIASHLDDSVQMVMASFDTDRDTPVKLQEFAGKNGLEAGRWKLLHGDEDAVRDLAAVLGVRYRKNEDGDFAHANLITVLDDGGLILLQHEGLGGNLSDVIRAAAGAARPAH